MRRAYIGSLGLILVLGCPVGLLGAGDGDPAGQALPHHEGVLALHHQQGAGDRAALWLDAVHWDEGALRLVPTHLGCRADPVISSRVCGSSCPS